MTFARDESGEARGTTIGPPDCPLINFGCQRPPNGWAKLGDALVRVAEWQTR